MVAWDKLELLDARLEVRQWRQSHDLNVKNSYCAFCGVVHNQTYASMSECRARVMKAYQDADEQTMIDAEKYRLFADQIDSVSVRYEDFYDEVKEAIRQAERKKECNNQYGKIGSLTPSKKSSKNYRILALSSVGFLLWVLYRRLRGRNVSDIG